jgi:hypothetical protein
MRSSLLVIVFFAALFATSTPAFITPSADVGPMRGWSTIYHDADRIIHLHDGSDVLLINRPAPKQAQAIDADFFSSKGRSYDTHFRVAKWISGELAEGTTGQIYSVAMSDDNDWLAVVGGWIGRDARGHNGVFILRREAQPGDFDFWRLKTWFDVPGMTIGEIQFGPDDTVFTTSHNENPGGPAPIITAFTFAGRKLGAFITAEKHGDWRGASSCRLMRIAKLGPASYAVYDPEISAIRFITVSSNDGRIDVTQTQTVSLPFADNEWHLLAFDALSDGRIAVARTLVSVLARDGRLLEEWASPRVWHYAYVDRGVLKGVYPASINDSSPVIVSVAVK